MTAAGERRRALIAVITVAACAIVSNCVATVDPIRNGTGGGTRLSSSAATGGAGGAGTGGFPTGGSVGTGGLVGLGGSVGIGGSAGTSGSVGTGGSVGIGGGASSSSVSSATSSGSSSSSSSSSASSTSTSSGGLTCLQNIPSSCPDCMTQNPSDMSRCQMYIACFESNDCNPADACGQNSGVCGVNTIGGGEAPYQAAVTTYNCACP